VYVLGDLATTRAGAAPTLTAQLQRKTQVTLQDYNKLSLQHLVCCLLPQLVQTQSKVNVKANWGIGGVLISCR